MEKTCYKPRIYTDDGTYIEWTLPMELNENDAFETEEEAIEFMEQLGYDSGDISCIECEPDEDTNIIK